MSVYYTVCSLEQIPSNEHIRGMILDSFEDGRKEELRLDLLCILRAYCLEYLRAVIPGSPSNLLESIIQDASDQDSAFLQDEIGDKIENLRRCVEIVAQFECGQELFDRFCEETVVPDQALFHLLRDVRTSLFFLKDNIGSEELETQEGAQRFALSRPKAIKAGLNKKTLYGFYQSIRLAFQSIIDEKIVDRNFVGGFWISHGIPKTEDQCSEHLCSYFETLFYLEGVRVEREYCFAGGRCDFCFKFGSWILPVEAKRSMHLELWRAANNQLIGQYVSSNDGNPYGIYLVYWFGESGLACKPREVGCAKPSSSEELARSLFDYTVPDANKSCISVFCFDCTHS